MSTDPNAHDAIYRLSKRTLADRLRLPHSHVPESSYLSQNPSCCCAANLSASYPTVNLWYVNWISRFPVRRLNLFHHPLFKRDSSCCQYHTHDPCMCFQLSIFYPQSGFVRCVQCHRDVWIWTMIAIVASLPHAIIACRIEQGLIAEE